MGNRSPEQIVEAIESNLIDSSLPLAHNQDGVVFHDSQVTWVYTGFRSLSRVLGARFEAEEAEDRIAEIAECFRQWDAPVVWVVGPGSRPAKLSQFLCESGFGVTENWVGSACDLTGFSAEFPSIPNFRCEKLSQADEFDAWVGISSEPWGAENIDGALKIFSMQNAGSDARCSFYLAYHRNKPVGRCMVYVHKGVAGLYWVAGVEEIAPPGCMAAMCRAVLLDAKQAGCKMAVTTNSPIAGSVFDEVGFRAFCNFHLYAWPALPIPMHVG